jgi:hypothetical protein
MIRRQHRPVARRRMQVVTAALLMASTCFVAAAMASGAVTATVTPTVGLRNLQLVHVHAEGLPANTIIKLMQCVHSATSSADCEGLTNDQIKRSDANGTLDREYKVYELPNSLFPNTGIDCGPTHRCDLYIGVDFNDFRAPKTLVPLGFGPISKGGHSSSASKMTPAIVIVVLALAMTGLVLASRRRRRAARPEHEASS